MWVIVIKYYGNTNKYYKNMFIEMMFDHVQLGRALVAKNRVIM